MKHPSTVILVAALAFSLAAAWLLWRTADQLDAGRESAAMASVPFTLVDQDGHKRTDRDFRGRWVLLYFGYTNCPDVCPTTLAVMANALGKLGPQAEGIVPVFVSVDPTRDTPSVLKSYVASFGPRFVGLTGAPDAIAKFAHAYGVYYQKHPLPGGNYSVDHSSWAYLLNPDGKFVKAYDDLGNANALAADLKKRISG